MDWFVLLTPIFVLILLPPVIVFGCSIVEKGEGVLAPRTLVLNYKVPQTAAGKLNQLLVDAHLTSGKTLYDDVHTVANLDLQSEAGTAVVKDHGLFLQGAKVSCTCTVTFVGWQQVLAPAPLSAACVDETDGTIVFTLSWSSKVWDQPLKDYNDVQFDLSCEQ